MILGDFRARDSRARRAGCRCSARSRSRSSCWSSSPPGGARCAAKITCAAAPGERARRDRSGARLARAPLCLRRHPAGVRAGRLHRPCAHRRGRRASIPASARWPRRSPSEPSSAAPRWITSSSGSARARSKTSMRPVLAALRLGLFQLLFLDGVADHAAVNESVELVKRIGHGGAPLVNAVLRRATREGAGDARPARRSDCRRGSGPAFGSAVAGREVVGRAGAEQARALLLGDQPARRGRDPGQRARPTPDEVLPRLPVRSRRTPCCPEALVLEEAFDVHGSELFASGAIIAPVAGLDAGRHGCSRPRAGARVLDLCARSRRQDDASRRPDGRRGDDRRGRAPSRARRRAAHGPAPGCGRAAWRSDVADATEPRPRGGL